MIGKIFLTGQTFGETCHYLCQDETRSQVLYAEGVRSHDRHLMAADFKWQHKLMPEKEKAVFHSVLSFPPGEQLPDERLVEIGQKYLERIGIKNTQYAFVKHTDKPHLHMHIIANKVDNDGRPTGEGLIIERAMKTAQQLTREYRLKPEEGKTIEHTNRKALHQPDAIRYKIYEAITQELPLSQNLEDLEKRLLSMGISVQYREDANTGQRQGISFRLEQRSFKGGQIDNAYSLKGLEQTLATQLRLRKEQQLLQEQMQYQYAQRQGMRLRL